jgi:hypothetical protein
MNVTVSAKPLHIDIPVKMANVRTAYSIGMGAPQLAEWMKQHPAERLAAWRCVIGKPERRGA